MSDAVLVACISGGVTLAGIIVSAFYNQHKITKEFEKQSEEFQRRSEQADIRIEAKIEKYTAVTDTKIEELTRENREHNQFGRRIPVIEEQIKVINHRIDDLERTPAR